MERKKEVEELKKQIELLKQDRDCSAVDKSIEWVKLKIEQKEHNIFWRILLTSWIVHTAIPMFIFLIGITIGVFLGLDSK